MYNPPIDDRTDAANVLALYEEGLRLTDIAAATGRSVSGVHRYLSGREWYLPRARRGRRPRPTRIATPPVSAEERARMAALYEGGATIRQIALATRRTRSATKRALVRAGVYDLERQEAARGHGRRGKGHPWQDIFKREKER